MTTIPSAWMSCKSGQAAIRAVDDARWGAGRQVGAGMRDGKPARPDQQWEQLHLEGALNSSQETFWDPKPYEELYDIHRDRDCVDNLADDRRHRST